MIGPKTAEQTQYDEALADLQAELDAFNAELDADPKTAFMRCHEKPSCYDAIMARQESAGMYD